MRKTLIVLAALVAVFAMTGTNVMACGEAKSSAATTVSETGDVTISGTLVCLGCDLKKADGARAACSVYGHKHALKTADGRYINLLENQYSDALVNGDKYHNKAIKVAGTMFANSNTMDVRTFTVDGKTSGWCGGCKTMDGCGVKQPSEM